MSVLPINTVSILCRTSSNCQLPTTSKRSSVKEATNETAALLGLGQWYQHVLNVISNASNSSLQMKNEIPYMLMAMVIWPSKISSTCSLFLKVQQIGESFQTLRLSFQFHRSSNSSMAFSPQYLYNRASNIESTFRTKTSKRKSSDLTNEKCHLNVLPKRTIMQATDKPFLFSLKYQIPKNNWRQVRPQGLTTGMVSLKWITAKTL